MRCHRMLKICMGYKDLHSYIHFFFYPKLMGKQLVGIFHDVEFLLKLQKLPVIQKGKSSATNFSPTYFLNLVCFTLIKNFLIMISVILKSGIQYDLFNLSLKIQIGHTCKYNQTNNEMKNSVNTYKHGERCPLSFPRVQIFSGVKSCVSQ